MPPPNTQRSMQLADAATRVLANQGARGLTHRAVDAEAAVPPGTTSRYFRSRDALLHAVLQHALHQHRAEIAAVADTGTPLTPAELADGVTTLIHRALGPERTRHLAIAELSLEATRRPELRPVMADVTNAQRTAIRAMLAATGKSPSEQSATRFTLFVTGVLFTHLTAPQSMGPDDLAEVDALIRAEVTRLLHGC
jgi:DNA-binding transcriptional regulator YbjK